MTSRQSMRGLLAVALLLFLSLACKQPKGREWDNAYPDESGTLDVDGPPRVRADERWLDRRTTPDPLDQKKAQEKDKKKDAEGTKTDDPTHKDGH